MRRAAFIDGMNLHATVKALQMDIDYKALLAWMRHGANLVGATYYTTVRSEPDDHQSIRPLLDWLDYNGYRLRTKPARSYVDQSGMTRWRGDMGVEICLDAIKAARDWRLDEIMLFSGDGDYTPLVADIQALGVGVTVVSELKAMQPPMVSDELRRQADSMVSISEIAEIVMRKREVTFAVERRNRHVGGTV